MHSENMWEKRGVHKMVKEYEESQARNSGAYFDLDQLLEIAEFYLDIFENEKAIQVLEKAYQIYPSDCDVLSKMINAYLFENETEKAFDCAQKALSIFPNNPDFHFQSAEVFEKKEDFPNAEKYYLKTLELINPGDDLELEVYESYLACLFSFAMHEKAYNILKELIYKYPNNYSFADDLDLCITYLDKNYETIEFLRKQIEEDPLIESYWYLLGNCYNRLELLDKAIDAYKYVLCLNEKNDLVLKGIADIYIEKEEFDTALSYLRIILDLEEKAIPNADIYLSMGRAYEQQEDYALAQEAYRYIINEDPSFDEAWYGLAMCLVGEEKFESSLEYFQKALDLEPTSDFYWSEYARALQKANQIEKAIEAFEKSCQLEPFDAFHWIDFASVYLESDLEKSLEILESAQKLNPNKDELLYQIAGIYFLQGKNVQGAHLLESALENAPEKQQWLFYKREQTQLENHALVRTIIAKHIIN